MHSCSVFKAYISNIRPFSPGEFNHVFLLACDTDLVCFLEFIIRDTDELDETWLGESKINLGQFEIRRGLVTF